jgi:hypothetical protein
MKCRKNVRKLIQEYNAASPANKPNTPLIRFRDAVVALKAAPSRLPAPHNQANRYDDYVYVHQQSMAPDPAHPMPPEGPHPGHRGPMFFPWHREFLRQFENDLRSVSGDPDICLPYWDWSTDQTSADPGYPFFEEFLGGNGVGAGIVVGGTTVFSTANGWALALADEFDNNPNHQNAVHSLQRQFNGPSPTLPPRGDVIASLGVNVYDSDPWDVNSAGGTSFRNKVEGWPAGFNATTGAFMHNRVHVGVGGSMLPATSPNDPVFFLNHAKEDELWAVWMQKHPNVAHYMPPDGLVIPPAKHHLKRLSDHMDSLSDYFGPGTIDRPIDLLDHKAITWYDTDLPEITLESGPAIAFNNTPSNLTVAKRIRFRVKSCRPVFFSITGQPTGNFSIVGGPDFPVTPIEANDFEILEIEVRFIGQGANVQVSAVDIQAHVIDEEGYYAANANDPFVVENFHIELVANNIVTSDSSIALVLDRSGSMGDVANNGFTKNQLLKSAVGVVHELMKDSDQIGIARFDHESDALLPMTSKSAGLGATLTGPGLDPRGSTNIAGGILVGSGLINGPGATHPNKALIVLTDGNDYPVPNTIATLPPGTINQTTFAIGFGLPGQVNDATLSQISVNTGGYLLTTGNVATDDERFKLAKFFIRILVDATLNQTIADPEGQLLWNGQAQEIDFLVSDSDLSIDVVALCPIPFALEFQLITPGGQMITRAMSGVEPNVRYHIGHDVAYYRVMLPALPGKPGDTHRGMWKALLGLRAPGSTTTGLTTHIPKQDAERASRLREFAAKPTPYNLSVHTYSNLTLDATLRQTGFAPGDVVHLTASLWEYRAPLMNPATVWADVLQPDGSRATLRFTRASAGDYRADWTTTRPGVYQFVIRAEGRTTSNARFTRAKELTAGVWAGGDRPFDPIGGSDRPGGNDGKGDEYCKTILCLIEHVMKSPTLQERFKAIGFDLDSLRRCIETQCRKGRTMEGKTVDSATPDLWQTLSRAPEFSRLITTLASSGLAELKVLEAAKTKPVRRKPKLESSSGNMFVLPEDPVTKKDQKDDKPKK